MIIPKSGASASGGVPVLMMLGRFCGGLHDGNHTQGHGNGPSDARSPNKYGEGKAEGGWEEGGKLCQMCT